MSRIWVDIAWSHAEQFCIRVPSGYLLLETAGDTYITKHIIARSEYTPDELIAAAAPLAPFATLPIADHLDATSRRFAIDRESPLGSLFDRSYVERTLTSARTFLSRWTGVRGQMRELTIGHKTLRIVLFGDDRPGNLLIACIDPQRIEGPVNWTHCDVHIDATTETEDGEPGFVVTDEVAGLEIICGALEVSENVKLY